MAKFKVGDEVTVDGQAGTIVEVAVHDEHWFAAGHPQLYGVCLAHWERVVVGKDGAGKDVCRFKHPETGELRDHECDTLGAVKETDITGRGHLEPESPRSKKHTKH